MVCGYRIRVKFDLIILFINFGRQKLLDRFDYDDEPEGGEETKREEASSVQPALYVMIYKPFLSALLYICN